jgi:hypothetical protein
VIVAPVDLPQPAFAVGSRIKVAPSCSTYDPQRSRDPNSDQERHVVIDPEPTEEQYNTSALDLRLGDKLLELPTLKELQQAEPASAEPTLIIDLYASQPGHLFFRLAGSRSVSHTNGSSFRIDQRLRRGPKAAARLHTRDWRFT